MVTKGGHIYFLFLAPPPAPGSDAVLSLKILPVGGSDFPEGRQLPRAAVWQICAENCMKMKEVGPRGRPWRPLASATDYQF